MSSPNLPIEPSSGSARAPLSRPYPMGLNVRGVIVLKALFDLGILAIAFWLSFLLRFEWRLSPEWSERLITTGPCVMVIELAGLMVFGVFRFSWRFVGLREAIRVLWACVATSALLFAWRIVAGLMLTSSLQVDHGIIPTGIIVINFFLAFVGLVGARAVVRIVSDTIYMHELKPKHQHMKKVPTLLIGAGRGGLSVAKEIANRPDLGIALVGFLDDDRMRMGQEVHGIPVLGSSDDLEAVAKKYHAAQAIITIARASGKEIRRITKLCEKAGIEAKIIPGMSEIVGGKVNLSQIRTIVIEDLLRREPISLDADSIAAAVRGRVVMVTGAGGSIGSELCRQIGAFKPARLVLVEQAENSLFNIHREMIDILPEANPVPCIADVCDERRMEALFAEHKPAVVFHAAAHKHVPMMEWNPGEAVKNNIIGTFTVARLASQHNAAEFVLISTDKAVNPTSVMGVTKRIAEMCIQALSKQSSTRFVAVRFGNVLGSAGSVVPLFKEQIAKGGPVTVTHPDMTRFFMTIPEACQLVLQAASMGKGGEIFILDMGDPVKIVDLARDLIRLSGLRPDEDIEIRFSGIRPGEKLYEEISWDSEKTEKTRHPKIYIGKIRAHEGPEIIGQVKELAALSDGPGEPLLEKFIQMVPEYQVTAPAKSNTDAAPSPVH